MTELSGKLDSKDLRLGFIVSRFNGSITERLLYGALDFVRRTGGSEENLTIIRVPGSYEIPGAAQRLARNQELDAIVCLGCLIRGETGHYDYIAMEVSRGIGQVALECGLPVTFGVITADSVEQAENRAGLKYGNKGVEAAMAAVEMANLYRQLG